jgi:hypothetical protein
MTDTLDDVVVTEGPETGRQRLYSWLLNHLAKFPGRVTVVTFAAGVVVTGLVTLVDGDWSAVTIVSLLATLWALFFAVMIYLLTAKDTDRVLEQIADLHEQLSTALASPDEEEGEEAPEEEVADETEAAPTPPTAPEPGDLARPGGRRPPPQRPDRDRERQRAQAEAHRPTVLTGTDAIVAGVPGDLLDAWRSATGGSTADLSRAWSRDRDSRRQWVFETSGHERWLVFAKRGSEVGVMSLDHLPDARAVRRGAPRRP